MIVVFLFCPSLFFEERIVNITDLSYTLVCRKKAGVRMKTIFDIQQFLKTYGTIIYVGHRLSDLQLMEDELKELYKSQLIEMRDFQTALLLLRQEIAFEKERQEK
jgi:uncharacterized protein YqgQ